MESKFKKKRRRGIEKRIRKREEIAGEGREGKKRPFHTTGLRRIILWVTKSIP
jgi:hypothetical protein